jgi:hypothetical protein
MFDDVKEFNKFETTLRGAGVPSAVDPRQGWALTVNAKLSRRNIVGNSRGQGQVRSPWVP